MNQQTSSPRPQRWQLDGFIVGIFGIMGYAVWYGFPPGYDALIGGIWGVGAFVGMLRWVWANQTALEAEDKERLRQPPAQVSDRTPTQAPPRTPTQQHFLQVYPGERPE